MIQIKRTILTLVALLAVTTGAWADETLLVTINSTDYTSFKSGSMTFDNKVTITFSNSVSNDGDNYGWYNGGAGGSLLTVAGTNGYTITSCKFYTNGGAAETGYTIEGESPSVYLSGGKVYTDANKSEYIGIPGIKKIEVYTAADAPATGPEVAWDKAENTGQFTMPGGNVTLEPEYFPQAALTAQPTAINDVPATTDGAIVNVGTVANIGETTTAQGTVMYYVSTTEMTDAQLLALAADQWTADVPTAESLTEGQAYVYYYVRGNDSDTDEENFSDGDILAANALTVTIAAEPTYAVTFADDTAEPTLWKAEPATDVKKGTAVTVTYTGSKKVIGVKVEKKIDNAYLKWDADQKKLVATEIPAEVTTVANADTNVEWAAGTYVVEDDVTINGKITLTGEVNLIIKDGATLTAKQISSATNLYIYGQANQTGQLVVENSDNDAIFSIKTLEVHSAKVTSTSSCRNRGAFFYIGTFNVYGGSVDAVNTAADGYGIWLSTDSSMNIFGGEVKAVGKGKGGYSYGITSSSSSTAVTVNGGKLWAENADKKALNAINIQKGEGFTGKIEYSSDKSTWSETVDANAKYVRAGY